MTKEEITITICGDFYSDTDSPDENYFSEEILEIFNNSDLNIVNLECPIVKDKSRKILKSGPHLSGSPHTFYFLKQINTNLVTLATNHLMDYGVEGLTHTLKLCEENSIGYVGAGMSFEEASRPFFFKSGNLKISIINITENEWSVASGNKPGANPLNIIENVRQIKRAKEISDFVLVIIHGGHEQYNLPNPRMVSQYRFYAENGASAIIGHHPHCISGFEVYNGIPVFYSLGNFLFTWKSIREAWYTGLIIKFKIHKNGKTEWDIIPVQQARHTHKLNVPDAIKKQEILSEVIEYSRIISNEKLLLEKWECFVNEMFEEKIDLCSPVQVFGNRRIINALRKTGVTKILRRKNQYARILNNIRCESHHDLLKRVIEKYLTEA